MKIDVIRKWKKKEYTIGQMYINGQYFCDTIEDVVREGQKKIYGKTAIPEGTYKVIMNYSSKFKRVLPLLLSVPSFTGIRIHRGNTAEDTNGCILVGKNREVGKVLDSAAYEIMLCDKLRNQNEIFITIK